PPHFSLPVILCGDVEGSHVHMLSSRPEKGFTQQPRKKFLAVPVAAQRTRDPSTRSRCFAIRTSLRMAVGREFAGGTPALLSRPFPLSSTLSGDVFSLPK